LVPKLSEVGEEACDGLLTHVDENGEFFVQVIGPGLEKLDIITKDISSHFSQGSRASEIIARPEAGQLCCAKWLQASGWYRAQVKQVFYEIRKVEVEFIDYGNREIIPMVLIRKPLAVNKSVATLPFQAIKVKLDGNQQLHLEDENMQAKLKDFVYQMDNVPVKIKTVAREKDLDVVHITVPVPDQDTSLDFLDCFREFINVDDFADDGDGLISPDTPNTTTTPTPINHNDTANTTFENISMYNNTLVVDDDRHHTNAAARNNTTMSEWDVISSGNSPEKSRTSISNDHTENTLKQHLSDIKEEKSSSGVSSSSSSSFGLHSPRPTTSPATTFNQEWGMPEMKITDRFIEGIIQDVVDPSKFSIIPYNYWDGLVELYKNMYRYYTYNTNTSLRDISMLSPGDVCAVYDKERETCYRSVIHAIIEDKMVVKYADITSTPEIVSMSSVRVLVDQFKTLPFLCVRCSLYGVKPISGGVEWDVIASEKFQAMVVDQTFQVEIISDVAMLNKSYPIQVTLHGAINGKRSSIADQLVQLGLAKYKFV